MLATGLLFILTVLSLITTLNSASAIIINSVDSDILRPGQQGTLSVYVKNDFDYDVEDVSLSLDLSNTPFSTIGSTEDSVDEITEGDKEQFIFTLTVNTNAKPGDYNIPYALTYKNATSQKKGTFGVKIRANADLDYSASLDNPVIGEKSKLSLKIVNKGIGEAKFVTVKIVPEGYTLLSEDSIYIGSINSDDFETASFDIIVTNSAPTLIAVVNYNDLDNRLYTSNVALPLTVYSKDKAYELGIKTKSKIGLYIGIIILIIIIFIVIRSIRKRMRKNKSLKNVNGK